MFSVKQFENSNLIVFWHYFDKIIDMGLPNNLNLGKIGEDRACEYLADKGWKIVERNFHKPFGELDIVAMAKDKTLVFVEVKTMKGGDDSYLRLEDQMSGSKITKFKKIAEYYAGSHPKLINDKMGWRLDLLSLTVLEKDCIIKHYENIF